MSKFQKILDAEFDKPLHRKKNEKKAPGAKIESREKDESIIQSRDEKGQGRRSKNAQV